MKTILAIISMLVVSLQAHAFFDDGIARGERVVTFSSPYSSYIEKCFIPRTLPGVQKSPSEIKTENELCQLDFHKSEPLNMAVCPKYSSTNPGLEFDELPEGITKETYEKTECFKLKNRAGKKKVKFKQSVTCSYAPAIIAYDQVSRFLQVSAEVPVGALRTVDSQFQMREREIALDFLSKRSDRDSTNYRFWKDSWGLVYANPNGSKGQVVYTNDLKGMFGSLIRLPKKSFYYPEFNGSIKSYDLRFNGPIGTSTYQRLTNGNDLQSLLTGSREEKFNQFIQMREMGDMFILDQILGQKDRPGNIEYQLVWYYEENGNLRRKKVDKFEVTIPKGGRREVLTPVGEEVQLMKDRKAILSKQLVMADNECAVTKGNETKARGILKNISHIAPTTYRRVQTLADLFQKMESGFKDYLKKDWAFTEKDILTVQNDLIELADHLKARCQARSLKLDLDINDFWFGRQKENSCE